MNVSPDKVAPPAVTAVTIPQRWLVRKAFSGAVSRYLLTGIRAAWLLFLLLALLSHSNGWQQGPFTWWGVHLNALPWRIGPLTLLPPLLLIGLITLWRIQPAGSWSWGSPRLTWPLLGITLLAMADIVALRLATAGLMLALFWLVYLGLINLYPKGVIWVGFVLALSLVILIQAGVGIVQFAAQRDLGLVWLGEPTLLPLEHGISVVMNGETPWLRAYGLNSHPNRLGWKLVMLWLMLWPCRQVVSGRLRVMVWLALVVGVGGILVSLSRSAWLAWLAAAAVFALAAWLSSRDHTLQPENPSPLPRASLFFTFLLLAGPVLFALTYGQILISRLSRPTEAIEILSVLERLRDAPLAWQLMLSHPWRGVGLEQFSQAAIQLHPFAGLVHVVPLLIGAELGVPALLCWLLLLIAPLARHHCLPVYTPQAAVWLALIIIGLLQPEPTPFTMQGAVMFGLAAALWSVPWPAPPKPEQLQKTMGVYRP